MALLFLLTVAFYFSFTYFYFGKAFSRCTVSRREAVGIA